MGNFPLTSYIIIIFWCTYAKDLAQKTKVFMGSLYCCWLTTSNFAPTVASNQAFLL